jgi:hypothetical protein
VKVLPGGHRRSYTASGGRRGRPWARPEAPARDFQRDPVLALPQYIFDNCLDDESRDYAPWQNLWFECLFWGIWAVAVNPTIIDPTPDYQEPHLEDDIWWLFREKKFRPGSFYFCCTALGLNPKRLRRILCERWPEVKASLASCRRK